MFSHSATDDVYLEGLQQVRQYYRKHGIRMKIILTDDFTIFKSRKVRDYYAKHGIERQSSTPYQHWQNHDTQYISGHPRITAYACRLMEPCVQALDQGTQ